MPRLKLSLACLALSLCSAAAFADSIPYPNAGTVAPPMTLTATTTGDIVGYFAGSSAGMTDVIRLVDVTAGTTSAWVLNNHTSTIGQSYNFGSANAGDVLIFQVGDGGSYSAYLSSDPASSVDGVNHAYVTSFAGGTVPLGGSFVFVAGTYVGFEDLNVAYSDLDYNDDTFIFTNVSSNTPVPEPSTLALLGTGILSTAGAIRRRMRS